MRYLQIIKDFNRRAQTHGIKNGISTACKAGISRSVSIPNRIVRRSRLRFVLPHLLDESRKTWLSPSQNQFSNLRQLTLNYVKSNECIGEGIGIYSYKPNGPHLLYASCYAALTRHLYNDLDSVTPNERAEWIRYIQKHQGDDGLFRDHLIDIPLADEIDWWGWRHLTFHVLMALTALGGMAEKPLRIIEIFRNRGTIRTWLESRNWLYDPAHVSNEIQNYAAMLQYARDFQNQSWCNDPLTEMYDWLDRHQDPKTGLWGNTFYSPALLSNGVQTGYHLWLLYLYDQRPIQYMDRIIDSCLSTQNIYGGFGVSLNSSACEDIDSLDPLVRFSFATDYRRQDVQSVLKKSFAWIMTNMNPDGGWVFSRHESFEYGHKIMATKADESSMFPTWFRTLSLAYVSQALFRDTVLEYPWAFLNCPGLQFWKESS